MTRPVRVIEPETTTTTGRTPFQGQLVVLKVMLEDAKAKLTKREWMTLLACLAIYVQNETEKEEVA